MAWNMSCKDFQRIGDNSYFFVQTANGSETDIFIDLSQSKMASADERYVSLWLANQEKMAGQKSPTILKYKDSIYKLSADETALSKGFLCMLAKATNLFRDTHRGQKKCFSIEAVAQIDRASLRLLPTISIDGTPNVAISFEEGITKSTIEERLVMPFYYDPYTRLAETAFQKGLERTYCAKDKQVATDTCYYMEKTELKLVAVSQVPKILKDNPTKIADAINRYSYFLLTEYGAAKVAYMEHLLGIDLKKMVENKEPLTPNIVYQFNMVTSLHEIQDLRAIWKVLEEACTKKPEEKLVKALQRQLPLYELRGLVRQLKKSAEELKICDLQEWVEKAKAEDRTIDRLMDVYCLSPEEQDAMYSGRKIFETIATDYTTAEYKKRKIYVDLQELTQLSQEHFYDESAERKISDRQRETAFYERLAHIVCKKEIVHSHPQGLRIGLLVPARLDVDGRRQWYVIRGCTRTPYGKCSYTLEPASPKSTLPRILLHRSTFSTTDAASTRNDFNPLSGPGYEGYALAERYEDAFINGCTIPAWVGYAVWAEGEKDTAILQERLKKATDQLVHEQKKQLLPLSFAKLLLKYDYLLLDLLYECAWLKGDRFKLFAILESVALKQTLTEAVLKEHALYLAELIEKKEHKHNEIFAKKLRDFATGIVGGDVDREVEGYEIIKTLRAFEKEAKTNEKVLSKWLDCLLEHAKTNKEHPSQKSRQEVAIVGHSLGGALSQIAMVAYTAEKERIPLSKMKSWSFDAPGIHYDDCEAFMAFGNKHSQLLQALHSKLAIYISQEKGDIVVLGGDRHLGSSKSKEEQDMCKPWLDYENELYEVSSKAKTRALRDTPFVHGTRFQTRTSDDEVILHQISSLEQYQFDRCATKNDWERFSKLWKLLPETPFCSIPRVQFNKKLKSLGMHLRTIRPWFMADAKEKNVFEQHVDANGVFAIDIQGICSK